jgi:hypothetical protein
LIDVNLNKEEILLKLSIELKFIIGDLKIKYKFVKYFENIVRYDFDYLHFKGKNSSLKNTINITIKSKAKY